MNNYLGIEIGRARCLHRLSPHPGQRGIGLFYEYVNESVQQGRNTLERLVGGSAREQAVS